jgi:hypothetical protein
MVTGSIIEDATCGALAGLGITIIAKRSPEYIILRSTKAFLKTAIGGGQVSGSMINTFILALLLKRKPPL